MRQTLLPDQQRAWEELQSEQDQVTKDIALKSDIYKVTGFDRGKEGWCLLEGEGRGDVGGAAV